MRLPATDGMEPVAVAFLVKPPDFASPRLQVKLASIRAVLHQGERRDKVIVKPVRAVVRDEGVEHRPEGEQGAQSQTVHQG